MKTLYLLEAYPDSFKPGSGTIVSLTPEVSYKLSQKGFSFLIPEDFLSPNDLFANVKEYSHLFFKWLEYFDNKLLKNFEKFKFLNIKPAFLYGYYIQLLIDSFVVRALKLKAIFDKLKPTSVKFYSYNLQEEPIDYKLYVNGCSLTSLLLPLFSKKYCFTCSYEKIIKKKPKKQIFSSLGNILYYYLKQTIMTFLNGVRRLSSKPLKRESILILNGHRWLGDIDRCVKENGYQILYGLKKSQNEKFGGEQRKNLKLDLHLEVFDKFTGLDISILLKKRLNYFSEVICPTLEKEIIYYIEILKNKLIRIVITSGKVYFSDFAIMAAASSLRECLAVQVCHGYGAFALKLWKFTEQPCNLWLTYCDEIADYFSKEIFNNTDVSVRISELWTKKYFVFKEKRPIYRGSTSKPVVLYVPTVYRNDYTRLDGAGDYSDTWYFRHHLKLLNYFSSEKDYNFIWKGFPTGGSVKEPIQEIIKEQGINNIEFADGNYVKYLLQSDYTLHDYPSTPFYEAMLVGVPTLCFYHESLHIRKFAKEKFGDILQQFSSSEQAIDKIRSFLRNDPNKYLKEMKLPERNDFEIIEQYAQNLSRHS